MREFVEVLRHQQPFVTEMAMSILKERGIPCFMQEGTVTGLEMSPVAPAAGIGVEYVIYVHKTRLEQAREIVDELPLDKELLNVKWTRSQEFKKRWLLRIYLAIVLGSAGLMVLSWLLYKLYDWIKSLP